MPPALTQLSLHPDVAQAYAVLDGTPLTRELALRLSRLRGPAVLDLLSLAHKVRAAFAPADHVCTIMNAKSGACPENCRFCAQSSHHQAPIETYAWAGTDAVLAQAAAAYARGVRRFGLVTSGRGYPRITPDFLAIAESVQAVRQRFPDLAVCASVGFLSDETAAALARAGVDCYNINLQVNPARYAELIATTHAVEARLETIRTLQQAGIRVCSGAILGLGETWEDRIDHARVLAAIGVEVIPLNVLIPIPGTPLENQPALAAAEAAMTFALFRLILPRAIIKFAAGRETRMKDFQGLLLLSGVNGYLTGGYLTTRGRDTAEDDALRRDVEGFRAE